ncbi:Trp biosynthesis-associated membrane protein [Phytohabitans sp. ZYX-F-186]|uniref:Trp biosynthesis-associated membrane protein n=1 Tax=Phytohabitans maris TaxID=3071409 RepID=A0ABU0ZBY2_9ACTN|nr:Trp biosynthesis-associated membrane protein [Phytohabitans sp. ZYX-F-186]MDQ7904574.1 Trp biosynthesis-associated membrane protein [Phytohabitans sp. ZYX-F-186]
MNERRQIACTVLLCLAGAGLALFAATRTWTVDVVTRPEPLPSLRTPRTGGDLLPWLPPLAVVGLAGSGAIVATRRWARRWIGVLLLLVGLGVVAGGAYGLRETTAWALACVAGGLALAAGGALTALRGPSWPGLGTRYERAARRRGDRPTDAWDALDRGEDPTLS